MVKTFAAIDIGSYELSMKIYEVTKKKGMRQLDHIRHSIDMGTDTYTTGKLSTERVDELCSVLKEFTKIMKSYQVDDYVAYGTSAIRETRNTAILISLIKERTGISLSVLSNSEQRFLDYKSIAFQGETFEQLIVNSTAIYDVGGASAQISLFNKDTLVSTQNLQFGVLKMLERMHTMNAPVSHYHDLLSELVDTQLSVYKKLYLKDRTIDNLIVVDDYVAPIIEKETKRQGVVTVSIETVKKYIDLALQLSVIELSKRAEVPEDSVPGIIVSLIMLERVMLTTGAKNIWAPGVTLCDGIAYEYAEKNGIIKSEHNFEADIIDCAMHISKRYMGSRKRAETLEKIALEIFDATTDLHGLGERDRLMLRLCAILHDCGKYISMANLAECSYNIIRSTEIIGISHKERMIIANAVKYNQLPFEYYKELAYHELMEIEDHMRIAKLTAILRLANGLDRSHKMKFKDVEVSVSDDKLIIDVKTDEDITVEKGLFGYRAEFFEEIFNLTPVIKQHRSF